MDNCLCVIFVKLLSFGPVLRLTPLIEISMFPWSPAVEMLKLNELENEFQGVKLARSLNR